MTPETHPCLVQRCPFGSTAHTPSGKPLIALQRPVARQPTTHAVKLIKRIVLASPQWDIHEGYEYHYEN